MDIGWILAGIFIVVGIVFLALAILAPEWVGIQGKMARKIEATHRSESADTVTDKEAEKKP